MFAVWFLSLKGRKERWRLSPPLEKGLRFTAVDQGVTHWVNCYSTCYWRIITVIISSENFFPPFNRNLGFNIKV